MARPGIRQPARMGGAMPLETGRAVWLRCAGVSHADGIVGADGGVCATSRRAKPARSVVRAVRISVSPGFAVVATFLSTMRPLRSQTELILVPRF